MIRETNPLYNDEVYQNEIKKVFDKEKEEKKDRIAKYRKMYKDIDSSSFMKPTRKRSNHFETSRNSEFTNTSYRNEHWQT